MREAGAHLSWGDSVPTSDAPQIPRRLQKLRDRRQARDAKRVIQRVATLDDIPPGSKLSERTLEDIASGALLVRRYIDPSQQMRASTTYAQKLKQRTKANKLKRLALAEDPT